MTTFLRDWTENVTMKQVIDPASFWAIYFLYPCEDKYILSLISSDKIKARHFHSAKRFIDDLCVINHGGKCERSICETYPKELELMQENQCEHAIFSNLDTTIKEKTLIEKLFDKKDFFPISIVRKAHIESNISQSIFCSVIKGEFLRIACSTLRGFIRRAKELLEQMKPKGSKRSNTGTSIRKVILAHPKNFQNFSISCKDLLNFFSEDKLSEFSLSVCIYSCFYKSYLSIKLCVWVCVCIFICLYISLIFNLIKKYTKNQAEVVVAKGWSK